MYFFVSQEGDQGDTLGYYVILPIRVPRSCCYSITRYHERLHSAERLEYLNIPEVEYSRATDRSAMVQSIISTDLLRYSRSFHVQPLRD